MFSLISLSFLYFKLFLNNLPIHFFGDGYWNIIVFLWCTIFPCFFMFPIGLHCFLCIWGHSYFFQIGFNKERFSPWNGCKGANQVECSSFGSWKGTVVQSHALRWLRLTLARLWGSGVNVCRFPVELLIPGSQGLATVTPADKWG